MYRSPAKLIRPTGKYAKDAYRKFEFEQYKRWKRLPAYLKGLRPEYLERVYKITDMRVVGLLQITTQQEFASAYKIRDLGTLTDWNERIEREHYRDMDPEVRALINRTMRDFLGALYVRVLLHAKPKDVRLWLRLVDDWRGPGDTPKQSDELDGKMTKRERKYLDKLVVSARKNMELLETRRDW